MAYDPILCMNIPDSVSTKDSKATDKNEYEIHYTVPGKNGTLVGSGKGKNEQEAKADFMAYHKSENPTITNVKVYKAIDKAIKACDADVSLVKTVAKKNGYAVHIVRGQYGERIVLTFPNEHYTNPHMWLGVNNSSNLSKAQAILNDFANAKSTKAKRQGPEGM